MAGSGRQVFVAQSGPAGPVGKSHVYSIHRRYEGFRQPGFRVVQQEPLENYISIAPTDGTKGSGTQVFATQSGPAGPVGKSHFYSIHPRYGAFRQAGFRSRGPRMIQQELLENHISIACTDGTVGSGRQVFVAQSDPAGAVAGQPGQPTRTASKASQTAKPDSQASEPGQASRPIRPASQTCKRGRRHQPVSHQASQPDQRDF